jgi:hypothetical protein
MMVTILLIVWAIIGPSIGLAVGAWWGARVRDDPRSARDPLAETPDAEPERSPG